MAYRAAYVWNGTSFEQIGNQAISEMADYAKKTIIDSNPPAVPPTSQLWVDPDINKMYIWDGTKWVLVGGGGATGGKQDDIFYENSQVVTQDYTISTNKNAGSFGPVEIASGVVVTIPSGSVWTIV